jgi:hypothetical protein
MWAQPVKIASRERVMATVVFIGAKLTGAEGRSKSKWRLKHSKVASPGAEPPGSELLPTRLRVGIHLKGG